MSKTWWTLERKDVVIKKNIANSLDMFVSDPADSDYQRGYLAALLSIYNEHFGQHPKQSSLEAQYRPEARRVSAAIKTELSIMNSHRLKKNWHEATFMAGAQTPCAKHLFTAIDEALKEMKSFEKDLYDMAARIAREQSDNNCYRPRS